MRYWEDFRQGEVAELGSVEVTADAIVAFASTYDPQPFHVDPDVDGPFGGLVASGWHTVALYMSLYVRAVLLDTASMGSAGVDDLRWRVPVRPGDTLHGRATVLDLWPSKTHPNRGTVVSRCEALNQRGEVVLTMVARGMFARRPT